VRKMTTHPVTTSHPSRASAGASFVRQAAWHTPVAAAVLAVVLGLASSDAAALALGRVNVLSSLGEPLRAEIDVPEITAEEAATLRTSIASPDAFRAAGLEYNTALGNAQISLQKRANGSSFLRLSSDRAVNEPFVDLILEASWASGRIVRDYTMLFDPASLRQAAAPAPTTPAASSAAPAAPAPAPSRAPAPAPERASAAPAVARPAPTAPIAVRRPSRAETAPAPSAKPSRPAPAGGITVKQGDTAAALAARFKPAGVSLDQMLVAMLRSSPDAFLNGNVNRLRAGAVIDVQEAANTAANTGANDAKQTIVAQAKDFNEFRRRLASGAPLAAASTPSRAASGKVQANVSEPKAQASAPDKLTLSKGSVAAKAKADAIAKEQQAKDDAARVAELAKNIQDLNKLGTATMAKPGGAPAAAASGAASAPGVKINAAAPSLPSAPSVTAAAPVASQPKPMASAAASVASAPPSTTTAAAPAVPPAAPVASAAAPAPVAAAKPAPAAPAPAPEPSFMESLTDHPATIPAAGALLAGLAGLAFWRARKRKSAAQLDSSFLESRLQPDSFFGASGGQRIDTADSNSGAASASSMVYSPSQLDAAGDVDPVAEADVYLAYGRDLQAEEILKEALRSSPSRVAIHGKLLEIYSKRRDAKAFETVAKEAYNLTQGEGPHWQAASELGRELDPANPLYAPGQTSNGAGLSSTVKMGGAAVAAAAAATATAAFTATKTVPQQAVQAAVDDFDLDLDLDFSADADEASKSSPSAAMLSSPAPVEQTAAVRAMPAPEPMVDFDMSQPGVIDVGLKFSEPDLASLSNGLNFSSQPLSAPAPTAPMALKTGPSEPGALEFDLGDLSLDLPSLTPDATDTDIGGDPLDTKFALAMELRDIGDPEGARALIQEVADEASGPLKARALKLLADLG
jgi:pilus assembly protein FimV